ncbi:MAG TPA: hypothetical protein VEC57_10540 [Candidatus Limnocylindrales bacterium]|nr:hypothetical protein [Candidatus Limnocylindrales bacterium]
MNQHFLRSLGALAAAAFVSIGAAGPVAASTGSSKLDLQLASTPSDGDAAGRIKLRIRGADDGRLEVRVAGLAPLSAYELIVGDVRVADVLTDDKGNGRIRFRSRPRSSKDNFLGFDPRGAMLLVRSAEGSDVLAVSVPAGGSGSSDAGEIICCVPDDDGPECEDRTEAECAAEGGVVTTATTCLPSPCAGTPPPAGGDIVCCVPDDSGPDCEDRTVEECAAEGGVVVEAASCLENPCAGTPSSDPDTRCCLPDDSGIDCEDRTPGECAAQGGVDIGPGICSVDACADAFPPGTGLEALRVSCEKRSDRSRASVDGSGFAAGSYRARIVSGANEAISGLQSAIGDQVEFDFDSDGGDIAEGASAISATFLQGSPPMVTAQVTMADGTVLVEKTVACQLR